MRLIAKALFYGMIAWCLGFGLFMFRMPQPVAFDTLKADAAVVLTGGAGRLDAGILLLEAHSVEKLLISGVHPSVAKTELNTLTGAKPELFSCCIELDYLARNTVGNAKETAIWINKNGYKSLILITADYHTPRSYLLLRRALPNTKIILYPVKAHASAQGLVLEYSKYLIILAQDTLGLLP